jgi:gamma-glutamyltranspeptidase/glutathione hydrolase
MHQSTNHDSRITLFPIMKPFSWDFPYPSQRMPVLAKNAVATSQPLAAQAGLGMML